MFNYTHLPALSRAAFEQAARAGSMPGAPVIIFLNATIASRALAAHQDMPGQYTFDLACVAAATTTLTANVPADANLSVLLVDYPVDQTTTR